MNMTNTNENCVVLYEAEVPECERDHGELQDLRNMIPGIESEVEDWTGVIADDRYVRPYVFINTTKLKSKRSGKYTSDRLYDELLKLAGDFDAPMHIVMDLVEELLKQLEEICEAEKEGVETYDDWTGINNKIILTDKIIQQEFSDKEKEQIAQIKNLFSQRKCIDNILGEYLPDRHQIILYRRAIAKYAKNERADIFDAYTMVLAHEFFHAFHHSMSDRGNILWKGGRGHITKAQRTEIKESLADYFAVAFCFGGYSRLQKLGYHRAMEWCSRFTTGWPYAKAFCYLAAGNQKNELTLSEAKAYEEFRNGRNEFADIFERSLYDPEQAYKQGALSRSFCWK